MAQGIIYILFNPSIPSLLKIGMTTRTAEDRAREISCGTGIPTPYEVAYEEKFADCSLAEKVIHERLKAYRYNKGREFFRLPLKEAIRALSKLSVDFPYNEGSSNRIDFDKIPSKSKISNHRVSSAHSYYISCTHCSNYFPVTLKRGEKEACCPDCFKISPMRTPW